MVYQNSGNDLLVTQRALRHTNIQTTLAYLDTLSDEVTAPMPNFFFDVDKRYKMSNLKIIHLSQVALQRSRRKTERRIEGESKRIS